MSLSIRTLESKFARGVVAVAIVMMALAGLALAVAGDQTYAATRKQETFPSAQSAVKTMMDAMRTGNVERLLAIFGPDGKQLFFSGDETADAQTRQEFVKAYDEQNRLEPVGKNKMILHVGKEDWLWPIPLVRTEQRWRFDTKAGKQEILARRIGENELAAIQVCLAYVDAQREYAREHITGGLMEYAQKFLSLPGQKDGLCWEEAGGGEQSPLGPLLAKACKVNVTGGQQSAAEPYRGYFYKILTKQGGNALGGAYDYVVDGRMIGGFALVAYPAQYGSSGIMTFIVNQDGVVYERNLGKNTEQLAEAMNSFNPDQTWKRLE